jgi:hypothetical protein
MRRSRRENGQADLDIMIALSRLSQSDEERKELARVKAILSEPALEEQDTLRCPEVFLLHSESGLEVRDSLRVGSGISPDDSLLLRDYLRLFAKVVPPESVETKIGALISTVRNKVWENAEVAQKELEELTESFGRPETYRALLHLYGIRNTSGPVMLKTAQRLWELTQDSSDVLLWQTLKKEFKVSRRQREGAWTPRMDFVDQVWRDAGSKDPDFALRLAEAYAAQEQNSNAANLLLDVIRDSAWTPAVLSMAVRMLDVADRSAEADSLIHEKRDLFEADANLVDAWAEHALRTGDRAALVELTQPPRIVVRKARPIVAARVYLRSDMLEEAKAIADDALRDLGERPYSEPVLVDMAQLFGKLQRSDEFEERVLARFPSYMNDQIKSRLLRNKR